MLSKEEKLSLIKDLCNKHDITAYQIGEGTDLNTSGVHRIFSGEIKNPRNKTLNTILEYIEEKITGSQVPGHKNYNPTAVAEAPTAYNNHTDRVAAIEKMVKRLEHNQNIIASSLADVLLDTSQIKEDVKELSAPIRRLLELHEARD